MTNVHSLHISVPSVRQIQDAWIPHVVYLPLYCRESDEIPFPEPGTLVMEGDVLKAGDELHPAVKVTVPGRIEGYKEMPLYDGGRSLHAIIRTEGTFTYFARPRHKKTVQTLTALELSSILNKNGVYNTFDRSVSFGEQILPFQRQIHIDESNQRGVDVTVLVVRLFDQDPVSLTGRLLSEKYFDIISEGIRMLSEVIHASYVYVFYPSDSTVFKQNQTIEGLNSNIQFLPVYTGVYPCGLERDLRIQLKKSGFSHNEDHLLFVDSQTVYNTALAALYDQPVLETLVQINGSALKHDRIFKVRIGTPIGELVNQCDGLKHQPQKLLINGMVRGFAAADSQIPVTTQVLSVTVPSRNDVPDQREVHCIRCGRCHRACSVGIHPDKMIFSYMNNTELSPKVKNSIWLCNDCRECNTACPARLPLSQTIQLLREGMSHE